jgi:phage baseplate assembly protein gpV
MIRPDGTVVPHYLRARSTPFAESDDNFGNMPVREGIVRKIIYPDASTGQTRRQYVVEVQHRDSNGPGIASEYICGTAVLFGGVADRLKYTLRPSKKDADRNDKGYSAGSKVLVVCINGEQNRAYIIGGLDDQNAPADSPEEDGHHLDFEFNGIHAEVNDDGELTITYKGPTELDGTLKEGVDEATTGSTITFTKNGDITLKHGDQQVRIDHANKAIEVKATKVTLNADEVVFGSGTDKLVKGETYRAAQKAMHEAIGAALQPAIVAMNTASAALVVPPVTPAGIGFAAVGAALTALLTALKGFEQGADTFLSGTSKTG